MTKLWLPLLASLLVAGLVVSGLLSARATRPASSPVKVGSEFLDKPADKPGKPARDLRSVEILTPVNGDHLYAYMAEDTLTVVAAAKGFTEPTVVCRSGGDPVTMTPNSDHQRYSCQVPFPTQGKTITVTASEDGQTASSTINVVLVEDYEYHLSIEMDFWRNYKGEVEEMTEYLVDYYGDRAVDVSVTVDTPVPTTSSSWDISDGVSDSEFWAIESVCNAGLDRAGGNPNAGSYTSSSKWVFVGSEVEGEPDVAGYAYVVSQGKTAAGNYVFIAKGAIASHLPFLTLGGETTVLMHEFGHCIGILITRGSEVYDPDIYSVMSLVGPDNAGMGGAWYYGPKYWQTRDLVFYP